MSEPRPLSEITAEEERELSLARTMALMRGEPIPPFTPAEARWHAQQFIAKNDPYNTVRLLAEAYLALCGRPGKEAE